MSGGGGGSSQPTSSTVTQTTIPEYARPYAEKALGQAAALTDVNQNPYQAYTGERFAQFSPLQQKSFEGAYGMQTAGQLGTGTGLATAAGLGALGMAGSYNPYQTGQFTGGAAQQYMSPYMQNVVDIEKREAQRASDIGAQQEKSQFAKAGAFGGSRQAIVEAERARNLGQQMGDIQSRGLQSAYQQAADQFNREQQLREQSRQYGAGLGMQGLQTGLQAAGQLGQLGQQQFQQGMDINKLQQAYGTQQQQQVQNLLSSQYQDFLNAKQYPYQQLGFMSDVLRGLPLSQQYSQTYQQSPSMLGQLAGIGMGAYGMMKKDGGVVHSHAEGGIAQAFEPVMRMAYGGDVTDENFVEGAINRLSDGQLQQARQIALDRRDMKRVEAIDQELAERNQMKSYSPAQEFTARNGGIVAFSNGGGAEFGGSSAEAQALDELRVAEARKEKAIAEARAKAEFLRESGAPQAKEAEAELARLSPPPAPARGLAAAAESIASPERGQAKYAAPAKSNLTAKESGNAAQVATAMARATGTSGKEMMGHVKSMYEWLKEGDKEMFEAVNARINEIKQEAKGVKEGAKMRALAQFGFQMAAAAAQPGVGRGIAGALRAAGTASPTITKSLSESDEMYRRLMDTTNKLEIAQLQAQQAARKGDKQAAIQFANIERQLAMQQAGLAQQYELAKEGHAIQRERMAAGNTSLERTMMQTRGRLAERARAQASKEFSDPLKAAELKTTYPSQQAYAQALYKDMWADAMPQLQYLGTLGKD